MLLDKYLIENLNFIGNELMKKAKLSSCPQNIDEMYRFFMTLKFEAEENNDAAANIIYQVLYNFVSSEEVRDRHTSPRECEDIFCAIFDTKSSDDFSRKNSLPPSDVLKYDCFTKNEDWNISTDLSGNKREKADASIGGYDISLKTLKGASYNEYGRLLDSKSNNEINVGSFSYRSLFKGLLTDNELSLLGDRKSGLGSKKQIRKNVLDPIKEHGKQKEFSERLKTFVSYVYAEDLVILIKSNYRIDLYLIPNKTFVDVLCMLYNENENHFEDVWHRWENNNLRFNLKEFFNYIDLYHLSYKKVILNLASFKKQSKICEFNEILNKSIERELKNLLH